MPSNRGRYFSARDIKFINSVNNELLDDIIEMVVRIFKLSPTETKTNIYGESDVGGKVYYTPITITASLEKSDMTTDYENFGPDRNQTHKFKFLKAELVRLGIRPDIGDLILYNEKYFEIDDVSMEQLLGDQPEKSHSVIYDAHYTALSNLNIVERIN